MPSPTGSGSCPPAMIDERLTLTLPAAPDYLGAVAGLAEQVARLAGCGPRAAGRVRLVAEEVFARLAAGCGQTGRRPECRLALALEAEGLTLAFSAAFLPLDLAQPAAYSLDQALGGEDDDEQLGARLIRAYARKITLVNRGAERELRLQLALGPEDDGPPWARMVPTLREGLTLARHEHEGRLLHRLDDGRTGKSYLVRPLAHQVISLIDGRRDFGHILAQTRKVMPEQPRPAVEDLFRVLVDQGLVTLLTLPRGEAEVEVKRELPPAERAGLAAYARTPGRGGSRPR